MPCSPPPRRLRTAPRAPRPKRLGPLPSALAGCYNSTASSRLHDGLAGSVSPRRNRSSVQGYPLMPRAIVAAAVFFAFAASAAAQDTKPADPRRSS